MSSGGTDGPRGALRSTLEWTRGWSTSGGAQAGNAMRGGAHDQRFGGGREGFQPSSEHSVGEAKVREADVPTPRCRNRRCERENLEDQVGNDQRSRRGAGKTNDPLSHVSPNQ